MQIILKYFQALEKCIAQKWGKDEDFAKVSNGVMRLLPKTAWTAETRDGVYFAALLCSCGLVWLVGRKIKRNIRKRK